MGTAIKQSSVSHMYIRSKHVSQSCTHELGNFPWVALATTTGKYQLNGFHRLMRMNLATLLALHLPLLPKYKSMSLTTNMANEVQTGQLMILICV